MTRLINSLHTLILLIELVSFTSGYPQQANPVESFSVFEGSIALAEMDIPDEDPEKTQLESDMWLLAATDPFG